MVVFFFFLSSIRYFPVSLVEQEIPDEEKRWTGNKEYFYLYSRRHIPTTFFLFSNTVPPDYVNIVWNFFFPSLWRVKFLHYTLSLYIFRVYPKLCVHSLGQTAHTAAAALLRMANRVFHCVLSTFSHRSFQMGAQTVTIMG